MLQAYKVPNARFIESPPTTRHQRFNPVLPISTDLALAGVTVAISFLPSYGVKNVTIAFLPPDSIRILGGKQDIARCQSTLPVSSFSRESQILRERQDLPAVNCIHQRRHGDIPGAQPRDKDLPAR